MSQSLDLKKIGVIMKVSGHGWPKHKKENEETEQKPVRNENADWYARGFRDGREHVQSEIKRALGVANGET